MSPIELVFEILTMASKDLHDGAGLSDATDPNGVESNRLFEVSDCMIAVLHLINEEFDLSGEAMISPQS